MDFRILGPLEVRADGRAIALPGAKPRAVLAMLLLNANRAVTAEQLAVALWGEEAPSGAAKTVQVHVSRLRKALGDAQRLTTTPAGYELKVDPGQLDAQRFERAIGDGRTALAEGDPARAAELLEEALALWRGPPLGDLAYEPFAQREIARLGDLRVGAAEQLVEAKLALGRHAEVVGELEALIGEYPYHERLRAQLMLALYRCDRQADALQAYQDARRRLVEELGIEPGERLRELEHAILAQDPALAPQRVASPAFAAPPEEPPAAAPAGRRLVTVVFAAIPDVAAGLDPESAHRRLDRYAEVCGAVIERHGGAVEQRGGDAIVGVFGRLRMHEDDPLRAARAALEIRDAAEVGVGVESGEVFVAAGSRRGSFAAGEPFARAARLGEAAGAGNVLLGAAVHRLLRDAVQAEPRDDGTAWRLVALEPEPPPLAGAPGAPFVDRRAELDQLTAAFARAREAHGCAAVTVVGPAGIGKSRLTQELIATLGDDATVLAGGCPSYGEQVTYRPLAEIVGRLGGGERVTQLLDGDERMAEKVLAAIGLSDAVAQTEETFWAVRRMLERAAGERPLVVVVDDVHWAEPTLLDLLEHLLAFSSAHTILLVCLARPELLEARPAWVAPQPGRSLLVLDALPDDEARRLVEHTAPDGLAPATAARIVETAEGNPLFLEQLVAVGAEDGDATLPSSIHGVLAARIDRLDPAERVVLEHASVEGRSFHAGAVEQLLPEADRAGLAARLVALVRRQLIRAERSDLPGQDAFRFAHALIREAAYRGLPKQTRAELHEGVARWLDAQAGGQDETVGHHLAEASRHRAELGERDPALAAEAAQRLATAADAALLRGDPSAGARLLERAAALFVAGDSARAQPLAALGTALFEAGRMADATRVLEEAVAAAPDERLRARAEVERELLQLETEAHVATAEGRAVADRARPALERTGDDYGLCRLGLLRGELDWYPGQVAAADEAWADAAQRARRGGRRRELFELIGWRAAAAALGPAPVDTAIARCEAFRDEVGASPMAIASTLNPLALLRAMEGDVDAADRLLAEARTILGELGGLGSAVSHLEAFARLLAGRPEPVEAQLRADVDALTAMGEGAALSTTTALLAQAVHAQGRLDEAAELCALADRRAAPGDTITQIIWRGVQARILARGGACEEAQALARSAVALVEGTDLLSHRGDAMLDLADVLRTCGRREESDRAARAGLALYERKGNAAAAARARALMGETQGGG